MKHFIPFLLVSVLLSPIVISSCERVRVIKSLSDPYPFLDLSKPSSSQFSKDDFQILCDAFSRLSVYISDGLYKTDVTSPEEINVSDRLFERMLHIIDMTNMSDFRPDLLTRSGDDPNNPYSCVAYALSHCVGGYTFDEIDSWLRQQYNLDGGVPPNKLGEVMSYWWGLEYMAFYSLNSIPDDINWDYTRTVGVFHTSSGYGHMVNVVGRHSNGDFMVQDFSSDTVQTYNVWRGYFIGAFVNISVDSLAILRTNPSSISLE